MAKRSHFRFEKGLEKQKVNKFLGIFSIPFLFQEDASQEDREDQPARYKQSTKKRVRNRSNRRSRQIGFKAGRK